MQIDISSFHGPCNCGRTHEIFVKDILIEENALKKLPEKLENIYQGPTREIAVICDTNTYQAAGKKIETMLPGCELIILPATGLRADNVGIALATKGLLSSGDIKLIIAAGSGTIHTISRYLAKEFGIPFISIPTAASVGSYTSTVSVLNWNGFKKTFPGVSPVLVIADTLIISKAPYRLTAFGISDLLRKYTALTDWEISHMVTGEYICHRVWEMQMSALKEVCLSSNDLKGNIKDRSTLKAYEQLMYALLLSGIATQMIGNSRTAGAEDPVSRLWEMEAVNGDPDTCHGEKVSIGLMMAVHTYYKVKASLKNGICKVIPVKGVEYGIMNEAFGKKKRSGEFAEENRQGPLVLADEDKVSTHTLSSVLDKLPSESDLIKLLTAADCKKHVKDIVSEERLAQYTNRLGPYLRNRLTILRHSKLFKIKNET